MYHRETTQVWRTISRFQRSAYGGKFRQDGQLLVAGTEEGVVKLFNHRQKQLLRIFKGHEGCVFVNCFYICVCVDMLMNLLDFSLQDSSYVNAALFSYFLLEYPLTIVDILYPHHLCL